MGLENENAPSDAEKRRGAGFRLICPNRLAARNRGEFLPFSGFQTSKGNMRIVAKMKVIMSPPGLILDDQRPILPAQLRQTRAVEPATQEAVRVGTEDKPPQPEGGLC
jgi:hypothetical protein